MLRPWISANLAISADGKITTVGHHPATWTSDADFSRLLELRQNADALLIGRGTLETDRMTLTVPGKPHQPLRCIVSETGRLPPNLPIFQTPGGDIHLLATLTAHHTPGLPVVPHHSSLAGFLETLASSHRIKRLHCEGGGMLMRSLAELDAIDELHLTLASHTLFGGREAPTVTGIPADFLPQSSAFEIVRYDPQPESGECFLTYRRAGAQCSGASS